MALEYNPMEPITYELAKKAACQVREYMNNHTCIVGPQWVWPTFDLEYILQEWRRTNDSRANEFEEEHKYIHERATYNWHMYEEPDC